MQLIGELQASCRLMLTYWKLTSRGVKRRAVYGTVQLSTNCCDEVWKLPWGLPVGLHATSGIPEAGFNLSSSTCNIIVITFHDMP